jgi:hypothetical protein
VSDEGVAAGLAAMRAAALSIPTITSFVIGRDIGGEYDFGAVSVIDDLAGYEVMMNHPAHLEIDRAGSWLALAGAAALFFDTATVAIAGGEGYAVAAVLERRRLTALR